MRKLFITVCELEEIPYLPKGVETELFYAPLYEHAYRKIKDASNKLGLDVEFVRAATFPVRGATNEFNPDFDDIVAVVSPLVFLAHSRCIEDAISFVTKNDPAYATVGSIRSLFAIFGLGKMVSGAAVGSCQDFLHHISECGAIYKNISLADGEKSVPVSRIDYYKRVESYRQELLDYLIMSGVDIENREGVVIAPNTEIRRGTIIRQGTQIGPWTRIREKCEIGPNVFITGGDIEVGCVIKESHITNSEFEENVRVEPYCRVDSSRIFANARVGGSTEIKGSIIGMDTKIQGNSFIINSELGTNVSFGAGAVTVCHAEKDIRRCKIGDYAVIGCNASLVAPLVIGPHGYVAAGSTITDDVPAGALAVARAYQKNRSSWNRRGKKNN